MSLEICFLSLSLSSSLLVLAQISDRLSLEVARHPQPASTHISLSQASGPLAERVPLSPGISDQSSSALIQTPRQESDCQAWEVIRTPLGKAVSGTQPHVFTQGKLWVQLLQKERNGRLPQYTPALITQHKGCRGHRVPPLLRERF